MVSLSLSLRGGAGGAAIAAILCAASAVLVAALPSLLHYPFSTMNSILLAQGLLCTLGVVVLFAMRLFPVGVQRVAHTVVMWVLLWIPFVFFLVDGVSASTVVAPDTNVMLGIAAFLFGAASLNLVRNELAETSSLMVMWISSMAFVAHLCLAWAWKFTGEKSIVFWVVFSALLLVLAVVSLTMVVFARCWKFLARTCGVRWYTSFHRWRVAGVLAETLAVLALSQSTDGPSKSVLVPVVATLFAVFWGLMFLNALVRLVARFVGLVPLPKRNLKLPRTPRVKYVVVVVGVAVFCVATRVPALALGWGWIALAAIVSAGVVVTPVARQELQRQKTTHLDLVAQGLCATLACQTVLVRVAAWALTVPTALAIAFVLVRFVWYRSGVVLATQTCFLLASVVSIWTDDVPRDAWTLAAVALLGLASIAWIVVWSAVGIAAMLRDKNKNTKRVSGVMVVGSVALLAMFVALVIFSAVVGLNPPASETDWIYYGTTFAAFAVGIVALGIGLVVYYRCVVRARKQS